ncbi:MAG: tRNA pseudouridine(55) synthase TruB [Phycisphaeraceae bacterium]|nr:tRNA pseudouridine(55) synthase TruB [Phycisphaeraceae bacterium]
MSRGRKNHRPDLNGVLVVDKPYAMTSAKIVGIVRKRTAGAKVGHAGTLDPLATGVLVLCLGKATKQIESLMGTEKRYLADLDLSAFSPSDDLETEPDPVPVDRPPTIDQVRDACSRFVGEIEQRPPTYSAVQIKGERAYDLVRAGRLLERPAAKRIRIDAIEVFAYEWPRLTLDIRSGRGVYIRSLARDLGEALGTGGMLTALRRTAVGRFKVEDAWTLETLPEQVGAEHLLTLTTPAPTHAPADSPCAEA